MSDPLAAVIEEALLVRLRGEDATDLVRAYLDATTEPEYRSVGEHVWPGSDDEPYECRRCGSRDWLSIEPCPSKRERRRVGPWEPAPQDAEK